MKKLLVGLLTLVSINSFADIRNDYEDKIVIDIQSLVNQKHSGLKSLEKLANERDVILSWSSYSTGGIEILGPNGSSGEVSPSRTVLGNALSPNQIDFVIEESIKSISKKTSGGSKNYDIRRYALKNAKTFEVLKYSDVLKKTHTGGCKRIGCYQRGGGPSPSLGISKSKINELVELIDYALSLSK